MRQIPLRRGLRGLFGLTLLSACVPDGAGSTPTHGPTPRASQSGSSSASSAAIPDATAPKTAEAIPEGKPKWRSVPREQEGFYVVLDGLCSKLALGHAGKDVVVHYGGESMFASERSGMASFMGLRETGLESVGDPSITSPTGITGRSLDDFWIADSTGSRSSEGAVLHRRVAGRWKVYAKDQTNIHAWVDGGVIGTLGMAVANGEVWVEGTTTKPPAQLYANFRYPALAAFPSGDVIVISRVDENGNTPGPLLARHWSPTSPVKQHSLAFFGSAPWVSPLVEIAPDEVYAVANPDRDEKASSKVARWDGTQWRVLGSTLTKSAVTRAIRAAPDDIWLTFESGAVERSTPKGFVAVTMPEPIASLDGIDKGAPWAVGRSGKLYKREGETWKTMPLPAPAFSAGAALKAKSLLVTAADDVLVVAQYWEKGIGWKEQELHAALLRTKPTKETLRCNEPDPENNNVHIGRGFQSWPPMATAACTTPFVVLARKSNALKQPPSDWPKIRAGLKGHAELGEVSLVEFVSGDRTFVGTKAKDYDSAKKIAELAAGKDRLRPEIVCGEPEAVRTLPLDLAKGTVATP